MLLLDLLYSGYQVPESLLAYADVSRSLLRTYSSGIYVEDFITSITFVTSAKPKAK